MAYGTLVTNNSGQILISTEITSLHYLGLARIVGVNIDSIYNNSMALTTIPGYGFSGSTSLSGRWVTTYSILCNSPVVFFIYPRTGFYDRFYGILKQWSVNNTYYVDVMHTGATWSPARVLGFTKPNEIADSSENVGIIAYSSDGVTPTFDSRKKPLGIYWAGSVTPPVIPCDGGTPTTTDYYGWRDTYLDFNFNSNNTYNTYNFSAPQFVEQQNLMFSAPSSAQAVYSRQKNGFYQSSGFFNNQDHYSTTLWWVMYHQLYRINSYNSFSAGWGPFTAGYKYTESYESPGWFGGSGGGYSSGVKPFSDQTINYGTYYENTAMMAVANLYYNQDIEPYFYFPYSTPNPIDVGAGNPFSTYQVNTVRAPNGATLRWQINLKYGSAFNGDFTAMSGTFTIQNGYQSIYGSGFFGITGATYSNAYPKTYYVDIYYNDHLVLSNLMHGYSPGTVKNLDSPGGGEGGGEPIQS
jgi:hypothetical protein